MSNKEGIQPSTDEDAKFELQRMQALQNPLVAAQFRDAIAPLITPLKDALCQNTAQVASFRAQLSERDEIILNLQSHVRGLEIKIDDLEQQGRKGSIRVLGFPEDSPGTLDDKLLTLFNQNMKMVPPLNLNDIEVAHRLGRPPQQPPAQTPTVPQQGDGDKEGEIQPEAQAQPPEPPAVPPVKLRSVIVKFASRKTKVLVVGNCKNLKDNPFKNRDGSISKIYISDDLTTRRANLAFQARNLKKCNTILDIWTFEGRILIKDKHRRISPVNSQEDLRKFQLS